MTRIEKMSNFSIENILSAARLPPPFFPSLPQALPSAFNTVSQPSMMDFFAPYGFPSTSAMATAAAHFPFFVNMFPPTAYLPNGLYSNPTLLTSFNGKRKRRHRTIFSEDQLAILESTFNTTHYPDVTLREKLAIQCDLKEERVEVWFKNRRAKERKKGREDSSSKDANTSNGTISGDGSSNSKSPCHSDESDCEVSDVGDTPSPSPTKALPATNSQNNLKRKLTDSNDSTNESKPSMSKQRRLSNAEPINVEFSPEKAPKLNGTKAIKIESEEASETLVDASAKNLTVIKSA